MPESGEDSEDEWNYIKVQKKEEAAALNAEYTQNQLLLAAAQSQPEEQETSFGGEPNTYPLKDDQEEKVEELHAVSQALAESQEACSVVCIFLINYVKFFNFVLI